MNFLLDYKSGSSSQHFEKVIVLCQKGDEITQFDGTLHWKTVSFEISRQKLIVGNFEHAWILGVEFKFIYVTSEIKDDNDFQTKSSHVGCSKSNNRPQEGQQLLKTVCYSTYICALTFDVF